MESVFKKKLKRLFGENFHNIPLISEALHETDNVNRALAEVGDSVLNLIVKLPMNIKKIHCTLTMPEKNLQIRKQIKRY